MNPVLAFGPGHWGALVGFALGIGVVTIIRFLPASRRPTLESRMAPYLVDTAIFTRLRQRETHSPAGVVAVLGRPLVRDLARFVERILGGAESVRYRQLRAGKPADVDRFRAEQVLAGAAGALAGAVVGVALFLGSGASSLLVLFMIAVGASAGVVGWDQWLSYQANRRESIMLTEFPTVAELLALAVGAGEGAVGALERVCRLAHGELATELARCLSDARAGASLPRALEGLAERTGLTSLSRFVDGVVIAVERGTPLADVLRAQAQDVREEGRRNLMEKGGKKEIGMMIPVVFLVLPITVLFAVFPGFDFLNFSM
ncbi:MAG TPA: type II secretion system F family protein [Tetrasphaera sp.]|uniref:type II secretion system F family protein n=1 Tax=Nostocoides sp. TaxID=1917966 RepID=UPI002B6572D2|nr:type II secretion system F family protein [Tetrasphaera sp.]HNQ07339.1 type II secretion system F family protein [Tetrasphaera sp.]